MEVTHNVFRFQMLVLQLQYFKPKGNRGHYGFSHQNWSTKPKLFFYFIKKNVTHQLLLLALNFMGRASPLQMPKPKLWWLKYLRIYIRFQDSLYLYNLIAFQEMWCNAIVIWYYMWCFPFKCWETIMIVSTARYHNH